MSKTKVNEFRTTFENGTEKITLAKNGRIAMEADDTDDNPVVAMHRIGVNREVILPDPVIQVPFKTTVSPAAASDGGCLATPTEYTVPSGTPVVFQAIPAVGFTFDGWYKEDELVSEETIAEIAVALPTTGDIAIYEAKFSPVV